jgi:hypothetical protein
VRIIGTPGGTSYFTSIGQLGVYYGGRNLVVNPGFEGQSSPGMLFDTTDDELIDEVFENTIRLGKAQIKWLDW